MNHILEISPARLRATIFAAVAGWSMMSGLFAADRDSAASQPGAATAQPAPCDPTTCLNADGPGGRDTYELIESVLGPGVIEHPDDDHKPPFRHIREDVDDEVGPHFVFHAHRDTDTDRQRNFDRSRIEIKTFDRSPEHLKGREGETFTYTWRFKVPEEIAFSSRFTHMFQLKSFGGDAGAPLITITGRKADPVGRLEIIHTGPPSQGVLARASLAGARGVWLSVHCRATFSDQGALYLTITKPDGSVLLAVERENIDLWRNGDFIRPKWGIYRGLSNDLRAEEDTVRFANFAITRGANPCSDCRGGEIGVEEAGQAAAK